MNYIENAMPQLLGCPDKLAGFYGNLHIADDERLHGIGVSAQCTRQDCTRFECPFHPTAADREIALCGIAVAKSR
jgi:hypothetical protein